MTFFSIIIPTFNSEKTIEKTLVGILRQNFTNYEILIIDNKSNDATLDIVKKYNSVHRIKIFSKKDKGMYYAINDGIEKAKGKYLTYCNSDDYYISKNLLLDLHKKIRQCEYDLIVLGGTYYGINKKKYIRPKKITLNDYLFLGMPGLQPGLFWKKRKIKFNTKYKVSSDYDFFLSFYKNKKFKKLLIDKNYVAFVESRNSFGSVNKKRSQKEILEIQRKFLNYSKMANLFFVTIFTILFKFKKLIIKHGH